MDKENKENIQLELSALSRLSESVEWQVARNCIGRAIKHIQKDALKLKMYKEVDRHAHSNYVGQVEFAKYFIKLIDGSTKELEKVQNGKR